FDVVADDAVDVFGGQTGIGDGGGDGFARDPMFGRAELLAELRLSDTNDRGAVANGSHQASTVCWRRANKSVSRLSSRSCVPRSCTSRVADMRYSGRPER